MGDNVHPQDNQMPVTRTENPDNTINRAEASSTDIHVNNLSQSQDGQVPVQNAAFETTDVNVNTHVNDNVNLNVNAMSTDSTINEALNPGALEGAVMYNPNPNGVQVQVEQEQEQEQPPQPQAQAMHPLVEPEEIIITTDNGSLHVDVTLTTTTMGTTADGEALHLEIPPTANPNISIQDNLETAPVPEVAMGGISIPKVDTNIIDHTITGGAMTNTMTHTMTHTSITDTDNNHTSTEPAQTHPQSHLEATITGEAKLEPMPTLHMGMPPVTQVTPTPVMPPMPAVHTILTPTKPSTKQERMDAIWMKHYKELQEYKTQNCHVRVPRKSGPLGEWVRTQRRYYKLWRRGESVPLTKERMELLDHLGFVWLPAEEKVGGGFRGGRPKKRKREEEDALAAVNAAAAAAAVAAGGHSVPGFYHQLSPSMNMNISADGSIGNVNVASATSPNGSVVGGVGSVGGMTPVAGSVGAAAAAASPYAYHHLLQHHHDPYLLQNLTKRSDIANQIKLLQNHQPLNRQPPPGPKPTFRTEALTNAHSHYEDVVSVLKRSNEELRDAELALDRAKKKYDQAQTLKDQADTLLAEASEEVLKVELEDGDDEWIAMYKCLLAYKAQNGNILFPRVSNSSGNSSNSGIGTNNNSDGEDGDIAVATEEDIVSYGTMNIIHGSENMDDQSLVKTEDPDKLTENTEQRDIGQTSEEGQGDTTENCVKPDEPAVGQETVAAAIDAVNNMCEPPSTEPNVSMTKTEGDITEPMDIDVPDDTNPIQDTTNDTTPVGPDLVTKAEDGTVATEEVKTDSVPVTEPVLHDWVSRMRKFPKKQFKKWRRHALDNLDFVWHQYNATWTDRYRELIEFRNEHGHTVVPTSNSNLGIWVGTQRKQYRLMQQGKPSHMTLERVKMLSDIDFVWHVNTWNERYEELKTFKDQFGHFLVPTDHQNRQLRPWITTQRSHYRFLQEGKPSQLTQDRIDLLDKIGFPWKTREDWQTRYQELAHFIEENGNCAVPRNYGRYPKLYRWVNCQRMEYQKYAEGSASRLKADQIQLLESVGFE